MGHVDRDIRSRSVLIIAAPARAAYATAALGALPGVSVTACPGEAPVAMDALTQHRPDVVLLDLALDGGATLNLLDACRHAPWDCAALVIAPDRAEEGADPAADPAAEPEALLAAARHGARGFVSDQAGSAGLARAVTMVLAGGAPVPPKVARLLLEAMARGEAAPRAPALPILTQREREILSDLAAGYRRQEVALRLGISVGTVGNHINNIFKKLGVNSNLSAVAKASRLGLL
ncbi:MAG: response regulator transcription factor [Pseudomonadota bacterium]